MTFLRNLDLNEEPIYPVDSDGSQRVWRWGIKRIALQLDEIVPRRANRTDLQIYYKYRPNKAGVLPLTVWIDKKYSATEYGTATLKGFLGIAMYLTSRSRYMRLKTAFG